MRTNRAHYNIKIPITHLYHWWIYWGHQGRATVQFSGKRWPYNRLVCPPWEFHPHSPHLGNPGSATVIIATVNSFQDSWSGQADTGRVVLPSKFVFCRPCGWAILKPPDSFTLFNLSAPKVNSHPPGTMESSTIFGRGWVNMTKYHSIPNKMR